MAWPTHYIAAPCKQIPGTMLVGMSTEVTRLVYGILQNDNALLGYYGRPDFDAVTNADDFVRLLGQTLRRVPERYTVPEVYLTGLCYPDHEESDVDDLQRRVLGAFRQRFPRAAIVDMFLTDVGSSKLNIVFDPCDHKLLVYRQEDYSPALHPAS